MWRPKPRRRPKLVAIINGLLEAGVDGDELVAGLDASGYVVLQRATREKEQRQQSVDGARREWAEERQASLEQWIQTICSASRHLEARCSRLYYLAKGAGVSEEELWAAK